MKILHIVCTAPPYKGGMGNGAIRLAEAQIKLGHEVTTVAPGQPIDSSELVTFFRPWIKIGNGAFLPQIFSLVKKYDVVHFHYPFFGSHVVILLACLFYKKPMIVHYHMDVEVSGLKGVVVSINKLLLEPIVMRYASKIIGSSLDYLKHSGIAKYIDSYKDKFAAIPFGIDADMYKPGQSKIDECLFVGALDKAHYFKGIAILLKAVARLAKNKSWPIGFKLQIAGDGNMRHDYEALARELGIASFVYFSGKISDEQLVVAYRESSFLILPSINRGEAFGIVLLEAMSSGTPVIASDLPGVRTVFTNGVEGILIEPGDIDELALAMKKMFTDAEFRISAGKHARQLVLKKYDWTNIAKTFISEYEDAILKK